MERIFLLRIRAASERGTRDRNFLRDFIVIHRRGIIVTWRLGSNSISYWLRICEQGSTLILWITMNHAYTHPPLDALVLLFTPELENILKNKLIELFSQKLQQKKHDRNTQAEKKLSFQRPWLKLLLTEMESKNDYWRLVYERGSYEVARNQICDKETSRAALLFLRELDPIIPQLKKLIFAAKHNIAYLESLLPNYDPSTHSSHQLELARARSVDLFTLLNVKRGRVLLRCPLHNDRTPSFKIFTDNKFRCFGCGEHGDAVDFIQATQKITFLEAVRYLLKF